MNPTTYWHIAHESYTDGDDLLSRNAQASEGVETPWMWDDADEGFDGDVVCLYPNTENGRRDADWLWSDRPTYVLLKVEVPDADDRNEVLTVVEEGYPAVMERIPAAWITVVRRGYADGAITQS